MLQTPMPISWEQLYDLLGIRDFVYFISSPTLQDALFPVKLVFYFFTIFFLVAVIYFYLNSSYLQYQFVEEFGDFFSWESYGIREKGKKWKKIEKRIESGNEADLKLAIIEADDFLYEVLDEKGVKGETFEELIKNAGRTIVIKPGDILSAHEVRNSIIYDPDYVLDLENAKRTLATYETAIKSISSK